MIPVASFQPFKITALSLILGGLIGCNSLVQSRMGVTHIGDIKQNWQNYSTVYLKGNVENKAPFLGTGAYLLRDDTGSIWIVSEQPLPSPGDEIVLKGQVTYQSIPIAGQELGEVYLKELEQLQRNSP
jgi:hypothetical protein